MDVDDLKHRLRKLKKQEKYIRYNNVFDGKNLNMVWDKFFSTRQLLDQSVKYPMSVLLIKSSEEFQKITEEFFYEVYYQFYKEQGINNIEIYDPELLSSIGLPINSSLEDIKKKFRELAKLYHPDAGGESEKFIKLMEIYNKLTDKNK